MTCNRCELICNAGSRPCTDRHVHAGERNLKHRGGTAEKIGMSMSVAAFRRDLSRRVTNATQCTLVLADVAAVANVLRVAGLAI